jgi:hypothetical protein
MKSKGVAMASVKELYKMPGDALLGERIAILTGSKNENGKKLTGLVRNNLPQAYDY